MESLINADAVPVPFQEVTRSEHTPSPLASAPTDVPLTIQTPATETAPRGHVIDDSARGTIFWEAEGNNDASRQENYDSTIASDASPASEPTTTAQQTTFGKPFKISWQSTEKLPFYRTRGLRNPWNSNREVKIARDGTEIEPTIGRKLITMFEQQAQMNAFQRGMAIPQYGYNQQTQYVQGGFSPSFGYTPSSQGYGHY